MCHLRSFLHTKPSRLGSRRSHGFFFTFDHITVTGEISSRYFSLFNIITLVYCRGVRDGVKAGFSGYVNLQSGILPSLCKTLLVLNCSSLKVQ